MQMAKLPQTVQVTIQSPKIDFPIIPTEKQIEEEVRRVAAEQCGSPDAADIPEIYRHIRSLIEKCISMNQGSRPGNGYLVRDEPKPTVTVSLTQPELEMLIAGLYRNETGLQEPDEMALRAKIEALIKP